MHCSAPGLAVGVQRPRRPPKRPAKNTTGLKAGKKHRNPAQAAQGRRHGGGSQVTVIGDRSGSAGNAALLQGSGLLATKHENLFHSDAGESWPHTQDTIPSQCAAEAALDAVWTVAGAWVAPWRCQWLVVVSFRISLLVLANLVHNVVRNLVA